MKTSKQSKQQYAYQVIRSRIIDSRYEPGHRIIIDQLARELNTSPIPVREAIRQLEADGLITFRPYSGAVVTPFNEKAYRETLSVLAVLEGMAASLASQNITAETLAELTLLNSRMSDALYELDFPLFSSYNRQFHKLTYENCGNDYLLQSIVETWERLDTVKQRGIMMKPSRMKKSIEEHDMLIQLLSEKAPKQIIEEFARKHKLNTLQAFLEKNQ
ncbi:GntR family transcriptional regulator [Fictibacillus iocasae]|uniref:GntR family transcriptional regulator n=1 Tax=Fictibacillus iocasae TaxID=2715437 RepID=A0ABW2NUJ7_9BACL